MWRYMLYIPFTMSSQTDTYEPNDTFSSAYQISLDGWYFSYLWSLSDQDRFQFSVHTDTGPKYIEVWLKSIPPGTNYNLELYSPSNVR